MRKVKVILAVLVAAGLSSCGNGSPKLQRILVSPAMASVATIPQQQVQFTAQGTFDNNTTRALTLGDGTVWSSSNAKIATVDTRGVATCVAPGAAVIAVTAPATSHPIFSASGSTTTSAVAFPGGMPVAGGPTVSGAASLTCVLNAS